jgi:hypothetical protein
VGTCFGVIPLEGALDVRSDNARSLGARSDVGRVASTDKEAEMALARVVSFDGVSNERIDQMKNEMREGDQPEDVPATEVIVLHDPDTEKSLAILFFETEDDYKRGDDFLNAMPAGDTPGKRTSVTKYDVAIRMSA